HAPTQPYSLSLHDALPISDGFSGNEPVKGNPGVVAGYASGICARSHWNSHIEHFANGWSPLGGLRAIAVHEILSLERHAVLDGKDRKSTRLNSSHDQISYA